jgi:hypothetical protein
VRAGLAGLLLMLAALPGLADDEPVIDHQPLPCTVAEKPIAVCATASDDNMVAKVRVFFRPQGEDFYSFVELEFTGINHCGTLPAPRAGKLSTIEYYVQAIDDQYQQRRTSTYQINIQPEGVCEFPPVEKDPQKAAAIKVFATNKKQGKKLDDAFSSVGVSFVPILTK